VATAPPPARGHPGWPLRRVRERGDDLVPTDTNGHPGCFRARPQTAFTTLVSVGARAVNLARPYAVMESPVITPDGRFVAFSSTGSNLVTSPRRSRTRSMCATGRSARPSGPVPTWRLQRAGVYGQVLSDDAGSSLQDRRRQCLPHPAARPATGQLDSSHNAAGLGSTTRTAMGR